MELTILVLLGLSHLVQAASPVGSVSPIPRDEPDKQTLRMEDALPSKAVGNLIPWTGDEWDKEGYKDTPACDPDQDIDISEETDKGTSAWLRSVGVDGQ